MKKNKLTLLKIGGSVITDKTEELKVRIQAITRLAEEIYHANLQKLIVVHGGGSFGHPLARRYSLKEGFREEIQKTGFSETHHMMTVLNGLFMDELIARNIPAVSVTPSSCMMTENGRIKNLEDKILKAFLDTDFVPVLYGDAVLDSKLGFTILSGDQIVSVLATRFNAEHIIIGVDVDGLYDADPKVEESAKLYKHLSLEDLKRLQNRINSTTSYDVTGGMFGKIEELLPALEMGIPVTLVNAMKPNYIYNTLRGKEVESTRIERE